jgi:hypothetical protein
VRDIDFEVIPAAENSNKVQKTRFWKEKSVGKVVIFGPTAQATLVYIVLWVKYNLQIALKISLDFRPVCLFFNFMM